jgi:hypothetical protein
VKLKHNLVRNEAEVELAHSDSPMKRVIGLEVTEPSYSDTCDS